jgi:hypothetical protein
MVWRFAPMADPLVSEWHSRDLDSRISLREVAAVEDWQSSGATYHIMRDHPYHVAHILGGLFGMKITWTNFKTMKSDFQAILDFVKTWPGRSGLDQVALDNYVWPHAQLDMIAHDSYLCQTYPGPFNRAWPTQRISGPNFTAPTDSSVNNFVGSNGGCITLKKHKTCPKPCRPKNHQNWLLC